MNVNEEKLKLLMNKNLTKVDETQSLKNVLSRAKKITAVKDVSSLFVGWIWVVLMGFGASVYSAKRQFGKHKAKAKVSKL